MTDDVASRLVGELEATGTPAESGEFTLDEAAALRKLAEYRLADPHDWLCLVVEAATLLGASKITIDSKRGELVVEFDGAAVGLEGLFGSVFAAGPEPSPSERARRKLAIALHALFASEGLRQVEIAEASGRLVVDPKRVCFEAPSEGEVELGRTRLHVLRRGRRWPELARVRERCCYASLDVVVDGTSIAFGLSQALDAVQAGKDRWRIHDQDQAIGWYGWRNGFPFPAELLLVCNGVLAERIPLVGVGDLAIVEGHFRKDVSETKVLRNEYFDHVMGLVVSHRARHAPNPASAPIVPAAVASKGTNPFLGIGIVVASIIMVIAMASSGSKSRSGGKTRPTPKAKPVAAKRDALRTAEISTGFAATLPDVQECGLYHQVAPATAFAFKAWIDSRGRVAEVQFAGALVDTELADCVEGALKRASFRSFDGVEVPLEQRRQIQGRLSLGILEQQAERQAAVDAEMQDLERIPGTQLVHWVLQF